MGRLNLSTWFVLIVLPILIWTYFDPKFSGREAVAAWIAGFCIWEIIRTWEPKREESNYD